MCLLAQPKEGKQQFKDKKQPELTENRTVWESDNQGDKAETFIQTGRRCGDVQPEREDSWQGSGWQTGWQTAQPRAPAQGNKASNLSVKRLMGVEMAAGETPSLTGEVVGGNHRSLECAHPLGNQHQRGPV